MKKYLEILKKCPLFDGIQEEELLTCLGCLGARVAAFDKKYTVMAEGSPARYVGVVLSGSVQIMQMDYDGNRSLLSRIGAAGVFAEAFACAAVPALPVSVIACEPCEIMLIDSNRILTTCANNCAHHRSMIYNLMKDLAAKTLVFHRKLEVVSKRTTEEKLMTYLGLRAKEVGSRRFTIPFDRQELADYLEVERSGLSSVIGRLKREGRIANRKNEFELLDSWKQNRDHNHQWAE
ncbi:MAG: Crp/Fnr family transcriptional regulator [Clostridia bacterium]|nr:Crp/Fnr family transcriptional regulator [Clostridia bacterium]